MKNKGRKHKHVRTVNETDMKGAWDAGGSLVHITRPITSMSSRGYATGRFDKKKWSKRIRGYFKSQTKEIF
jgi:hypothetical protein